MKTTMKPFFYLVILFLSVGCEKGSQQGVESTCPCVRKIFDRTTFPCDNTQAELCFTDTFRTQEPSCEEHGTNNFPNDQAVTTTWYRVECP